MHLIDFIRGTKIRKFLIKTWKKRQQVAKIRFVRSEIDSKFWKKKELGSTGGPKIGSRGGSGNQFGIFAQKWKIKLVGWWLLPVPHWKKGPQEKTSQSNRFYLGHLRNRKRWINRHLLNFRS